MPKTRAAVVLLLVAIVAGLPAQSSSLFGRRAGALDTEPPGAAMPPPEAPEKGKAEPDDPFASPGAGQPASEPRPREDGDRRGDRPRQDDREKEKDGGRAEGGDSGPDAGVRIRPVEAAPPGAVVAERLDFRLANIGKPYAKLETAGAFSRAWLAFRHQHRLVDGKLERLPGRPLFLKGRLLQDLGEGRWLMGDVQLESQFPPGDPFLKGAAGRQQPSQAIVVLADGRGAEGLVVTLPAIPVGKVDVRFDCKVPPAEGRRVTLRRRAFVESPVLPDDEASREAFRQAVAAGAALGVVLPERRDCRPCNGLGFIRRPVPGRIQDARDDCGACGASGQVTADVEYRFRP